jgi:hypothetical protein
VPVSKNQDYYFYAQELHFCNVPVVLFGVSGFEKLLYLEWNHKDILVIFVSLKNVGENRAQYS